MLFGEVVEIGSRLKINHHNQVKLFHIPDTHCTVLHTAQQSKQAFNITNHAKNWKVFSQWVFVFISNIPTLTGKSEADRNN